MSSVPCSSSTREFSMADILPYQGRRSTVENVSGNSPKQKARRTMAPGRASRPQGYCCGDWAVPCLVMLLLLDWLQVVVWEGDKPSSEQEGGWLPDVSVELVSGMTTLVE